MTPGLPTALRQLGADDVTIALASQGPTWQASWDAVDRPEVLAWLLRKLVGEDAGWAAWRAAEDLAVPARKAFWDAVEARNPKLKAHEGWDEVAVARRAMWEAAVAGAAAIRALHPVAPALPGGAIVPREDRRQLQPSVTAQESSGDFSPIPPTAPGPAPDAPAAGAAVTGTEPVGSQRIPVDPTEPHRIPADPNEPQPAPAEPEPPLVEGGPIPAEPEDPYHPAPPAVLPGQGSLF